MTDETRAEETIKGLEIVNSSESLKLRIEEVKAAQKNFATFTQKQVDRIFLAAATAASRKESLWQNWRLRKQRWELWRIR